MKNDRTWRTKTGYLLKNSDIGTASVMLWKFLVDRSDSYPLPEKDIFKDGKFEWGTPPIEKVITTAEDLEYIIKNPSIYSNSICIVEPWEHVGFHPSGNPVRASKNIAYLGQKIADFGSILFPIWHLGVKDIKRIIEVITRSASYVIEGGNASANKPQEWNDEKCSLEDMHFLIETLLQQRGPRSAPGLFICVGHQLVAVCLIRLLKKVCDFMVLIDELPNDPGKEAFRTINNVVDKIRTVGESLQIKKRDGTTNANGWNDKSFAISDLYRGEIGKTFIRPYDIPKNIGLDTEIIIAQHLIEEELETILDLMMRLRYEATIDVPMFHTQEVSEGAMLFANWAFNELYKSLLPHRSIIAASPISWFLKLPYAIKILASTEMNGEIFTECAALCVVYKDYDTKHLRRNFSIQFHPELLEDLNDFGSRSEPAFSELKKSDSIRLLVKLMYLALHDA